MRAPDHVRSLLDRAPALSPPLVVVLVALAALVPLNFMGIAHLHAPFNISPVAQLGSMWFLVGIPLAGLLTWRGWPGLAGLVASPYLLAQNLLLTFADLSQLSWRRSPEGGGQVPPVDPSVLD
jgi:hypothetical protein